MRETVGGRRERGGEDAKMESKSEETKEDLGSGKGMDNDMDKCKCA